MQGNLSGRARSAVVLVVASLTLLACAVCSELGERVLVGLFGPPSVHATEVHPVSGDGVFDHSQFERLLERFVDGEGLVDYAGLERERGALGRYIAAIGAAPFDALGRDAKLALLINAYNAFTLMLVLDHRPINSIRDIPADARWEAKRWRVGGAVLSLDELEHRWIRPNFVEPRIHFALVCAARGCPPLRRDAYDGALLQQQLEEQARMVHSDSRWFRFEGGPGTAWMTALYSWYGGDFDQVSGSTLSYAARYSAELAAALADGREVSVRYLDYDWSLNEQP